MRKTVIASVMAAIATVGTFSMAGAAPPGLEKRVGQEWDCGDGAVTIFVVSRNGWLGDTHYHAVTFSLVGEFTPAGGGAPEPVNIFNTWGNGRGAGSPDAITCTQEVNDRAPDGTLVGQVVVEAIPVH